MAEVQDHNESGVGFKPPNHSTKKRKRLSQKVKCSPRDCRVAIGEAFEEWRALKAAKGLRSDAALARYLLDEKKRTPSLTPSQGPSDEKIKLSQSEVQLLIEQEVCNAVKRNEAKLLGLIEKIQNVDRAVEDERSIQKLEVRINMMSRRAELALAHMMQKKRSSPSLSDTDIFRINPENGNVDTALQNKKCLDKSRKLFQTMEATKEALQKLHDDNQDLKAADLREDLPSVLTPYNSPPEFMPNGNVSKRERNNRQHQESDGDQFNDRVKPKAETKVQCLSSTVNNSPKRTVSEELPYPPLPPVSFPSALKMEAMSYNIPQRPVVHLALIREPAGLSVLWKVEKEDPSAAPMESYSIYMTTEKVKGSGIFPDWSLLGEVKAFALPMCVMMTKYKCGHKICVTVVGKDIFDRYGPYSQVVTTVIPG
ncbi:activating transcription factor 7-interacting protein 2 isoform X1 [Solea senegalensis]|uniref:Activating transcription factor 7-interacting protein 2 isoform X1 n=1 Tax=Solea senegalensis TaxID=28829 RepID=A0AAV6RL89_SOLSE|nr:activating transcription factor 7-interacting protein 2 [Solea senegalensis]KAG7505614.1 activating transcription factor 7-interacting protein 2 isoform X1 [Solea senegalensis]